MQPWELAADWGSTTQPMPAPAQAAGERPWTPAGPPPWIEPERRSGPPLWAVLSLVIGSLLLMCCGVAACAVSAASDPVAVLVTSPSPEPAVRAVGTCRTTVVGSYELVISVTVHNSSGSVQSGLVWVSWPITGEASRMYSETMRLDPGQTREFLVNDPIDEDRWMRLGQCDYGWSPGG